MAYVIVNGNNGNNTLAFQGITGFYNETLINPYSGYTITISGSKNLNNGIYDGLGGTDTLSMTTLGDVLMLADSTGTIMVKNVETFNAGDDGDIIVLAHGSYSYGNVTIRGSNGDDLLWSNNGNDQMFGGTGNDIMDGGGGNDSLFANEDNDYLSGGLGTDGLFGGAGNDTLTYNADSIWSGGYTLASFGSSIPMAALVNLDGMNRSYDTFHGDLEQTLTVVSNGQDTLIMTSGNDALIANDSISPTNSFFYPRVSHIETIDAGDGNDVVDLSGTTQSNVTIKGGNGNDILISSGGNDTLEGGADNDWLSGGAGNDLLLGGSGDDLYIYGLGDGSDTIEETSGTDSISFGAGITFSSLTLQASGQDLNIAVGGETIRIANHFSADHSGRVENLIFSDGSTYNLAAYIPPTPPVGVNDVFYGNEDEEITGNVLTNDTDANNDSLTADAGTYTTVAGGTVVLNQDGSFSYHGIENYHGSDQFEYTVRDPSGASSVATAILNIAAVNDAPVAKDDTFAGLRNVSVVGNVLGDNGAGTDNDVDGDTLSVAAQSITTAQGGTVVLNADGSFTYTAAHNFYGDDNFDYTLLDGQGGQDLATVSLGIGLDPSQSIIGTDNDDALNGTAGADEVFALDGNDIVKGFDGGDTLYGGDGNDVLYGDDGDLSVTTIDKSFHDTVIIPDLKEKVNINNLKPSGTPALGINEGNLSVSYDATASITFRKGYAGYNNTFGSFAVAEDGTLVNSTVHWANVKTACVDVTHQIDLPTGAQGGDFGFFIIANGNTTNAGYAGLNITGEGNIKFIYNYGKADARAAKITDSGAKISVVYNDGVKVKVLKGNTFFTTDRDDTPTLNKDGKVHVVSGLQDTNNLILNIKKADLATKPVTLTKNDITLTALQGTLVGADNKVGIKSTQTGGDVISGAEGLRIATSGAEKMTISLSDIAGNGTGIDLKIYMNGDMLHPVAYEYAVTNVVSGKIDIILNAADFGVGAITAVDISSQVNSALSAETFFLTNVRADIPGGIDENKIRIGFEDLLNTGDADYEDVLFDLDINPVTIGDVSGGDDYLDGGAGNDTLYGEGGNDILIIGLGADIAYGGAGADVFAITTIDSMVDSINDFKALEGDVINLTDVLEGYDPLSDNIANFVQLVSTASNTQILINADGDAGGEFVLAANVLGIGGSNLTQLIADGAIVTNHSVMA